MPEDQRYEVSQQRKQEWWERNVGKSASSDNGVVKVQTKSLLTEERQREYEKHKKSWKYDDDGNIDRSESETRPTNLDGGLLVERSDDSEDPQIGKRRGRFRIRLNKEGRPYRQYY